MNNFLEKCHFEKYIATILIAKSCLMFRKLMLIVFIINCLFTGNNLLGKFIALDTDCVKLFLEVFFMLEIKQV